jgi:hypothetical protein
MTENPRLKALQAILTEAQVVVECPTEVAERLPSIGFQCARSSLGRGNEM